MSEAPSTFGQPISEVRSRDLTAHQIGLLVETPLSVDHMTTHVVGILQAIHHHIDERGDKATWIRLGLTNSSSIEVVLGPGDSLSIGTDTRDLVRYAAESIADA